LPGGKAGSAQQVATGLDADIFVVLRTDFAQLKGAAYNAK